MVRGVQTIIAYGKPGLGFFTSLQNTIELIMKSVQIQTGLEGEILRADK